MSPPRDLDSISVLPRPASDHAAGRDATSRTEDDFGDGPVQTPIIILGTTRSGTTVFALMLGHHPNIASVGELEWVWDGTRDGQEADLAEHRARLATSRAFLFHRLRIDPALGFRDLTRDLLKQMFDARVPSPLGAAAEKHELVCQVHRHYKQAAITFPRARFIHLVRDGRDVCASWIKFGWLGNGYEAGLRWKQAVGEWEAVKAIIPADRRIELRFETLIASPKQELQRLCDFLHIPYDPAMLTYHQHTSYQALDPGQAGKWKTQLSARDLRLFEAVAGNDLIKNGYHLSEPTARTLTSFDRIAASLEDMVKHHHARTVRYGLKLWVTDVASRVLGLQSLQKRVQLEIDSIDTHRVRKRDEQAR